MTVRSFWCWQLGLPAMAAVVLYGPMLGSGLLGDDLGMLHAFDGCDGGWGMAKCVGQMLVSGVGPPSNQYRPLTMLSFALNVGMGWDPFGWHLVNVLLQAANAALVALLAWQIVDEDTQRVRLAALMAGMLFAWFAPAVEATAWVAARFDGMALMWMLVAGCAFMASREGRDRYAALSLVATVLAFMSKESAAIGPLLIVALAWRKEAPTRAALSAVATALRRAWPWLAIAMAYFVLRRILFGDPFRFFPGSSPLQALLTGEWLMSIPAIVPWARAAMPETRVLAVFAVAGALLIGCAVLSGVMEREKAYPLVAIMMAVLAGFGLLLPHWRWAGNGEGGRVLASIGALALLLAVLPLTARDRRLRGLGWTLAAVLLGSEWVLADAAVERWARAGTDMRLLAAALARTAAEVPAEGYAFVVIPDRIGAIPFGRNAQGGLMLPPVQSASLSPHLVVQTSEELARWPDLFVRDIIGRLRREPLESVAANPLTPRVPPPHLLPDRYFCWSPRTHALVPLELALDEGLANWDAAWRSAQDAAGCAT